MDAKITKQRLGNLLSYDWLKILVSIAVAVVLLTLFFTMVGTRPSRAQTFTVYSHADLMKGSDFSTLESSLEKKEAFSYEILSIEAESFHGNEYAGAAYTARRAAGMGTVYLVPETPKYDDEGKLKEDSSALVGLGGGVAYDGENAGGCYDTKYFLEECGKYLARFYTQSGELNTEAVRNCFLARNGKDKRFRTAAKKEDGIKQEEARIEKLRHDYETVTQAFESGKLSHISYEVEKGTYSFGISLSKLSKINNLVYYNNGEANTVTPVALAILYNGESEADLRFETVSFLKYLVEKYGE